MKAQIQNIVITDATSKTATIITRYEFIPRGGTRPITTSQEVRVNRWEKNGLVRLYLDGRDGKLGYWDVQKESWTPHDSKQKYLEDVVQAVVHAALDAMKAQEARVARLRART